MVGEGCLVWRARQSNPKPCKRRAVRLEAVLLLGALVQLVGRGLARALRALAGPWALAQADCHAEAAKTARAAFRDTFPGAKAREALLFTRTQVGACA